MDSTEIVSRINALLHETSNALEKWLGAILPRVSNSWWDDCVLNSLSYSQRDIAQKRNFSRLSDFDLAALLRIANKSWYDMRTVAYLPNSERECIREMMGVRNNWAHCSTELPGKDTILHDLKILLQFAQQVNCSKEVCSKIDSLINTKATGIVTTEGFVLLAGSVVNEKVSEKSLSKGAIALRKKHFNSGRVKDLTTTEDILFSSSSAAADFVTGYSVSGPAMWKNAVGKPLKEIESR